MAIDKILHLQDTTLDEFVTKYEIVYLNFWHMQCMPCINVVTPALHRVLNDRDFPPEVKFAKLNTLSYPEVAKKFKVRSVPSYGIFIDGQYTGTQTGFLTGIKRPVRFFNQLVADKKKALEIGIRAYLREFDDQGQI